MPLVTITAKEKWMPPGTSMDPPLTSHPEWQFTIQLGYAAPELLTRDPKGITCDAHTRPMGVQVDFQRFSVYAQNAPDIWVKIEFTEKEPPHPETTDETCHRFLDWIASHLPEGMARPKVTFDLFWSIGHGEMWDEIPDLVEAW